MAAALLRLANGSDVLVSMSVADAIATLAIGKESVDFVELPGEHGPVHIRPAGVLAVLEGFENKRTGFRAGSSG